MLLSLLLQLPLLLHAAEVASAARQRAIVVDFRYFLIVASRFGAFVRARVSPALLLLLLLLMLLQLSRRRECGVERRRRGELLPLTPVCPSIQTSGWKCGSEFRVFISERTLLLLLLLIQLKSRGASRG